MDKTLPTWAGGSTFRCSGSVDQGTDVKYGGSYRYKLTVSAHAYAKMLKEFSGREVSIGTSRTIPPDGSLGAWLKQFVSKTALASYVGPILIEEGVASRGRQPDRIVFK